MNNMFLPQTDIDRWMDIADFPNEIWKDVIGFEDAFQVSNLGRIKRKAFNFNIFNGVNSFRKAHILKPQLRVGGYYHVSLSYKGKVYTKLVHRLVAMAFISNPCNLPEFEREVIVLHQPADLELEKTEYCVSFAHRPNPKGWDGKSILTGRVEHYTPKTYGKGGWNIPDVKWWLNIDFPNES